ncbi:MAG: ATP-binding protein [Burkholderiaceae bacterium]
MITSLSIDEIVQFLKATPEQAVFDWKADFVPPSDDEKKGELLKDIAAIANASPLSHGFIFFGVNPHRPDPIVGITSRYDDAKLQQLVSGKITPLPQFLYYEVSVGPKVVSVIQVAASKQRPYIITVDLGKIRKGQIVIRRGSSTDGVTMNDLFEFFYGQTTKVMMRLRANPAIEAARCQRGFRRAGMRRSSRTLIWLKLSSGPSVFLPPSSIR